MFVFYCTVSKICTVGYVCLFCGDQISMYFVSFLSMIIYEDLYAWCLRHNICSAWFLDIRIPNCFIDLIIQVTECYTYFGFLASFSPTCKFLHIDQKIQLFVIKLIVTKDKFTKFLHIKIFQTMSISYLSPHIFQWYNLRVWFKT